MWSSWNGFGGGITELGVGINLDGRLEVFAIGTDTALNHIFNNPKFRRGWHLNWKI